MDKIKVRSSGSNMNSEKLIKMLKGNQMEISNEEATTVLSFLKILARIVIVKYLEVR
jgi:hypothetical protein